MKTTFWAVLLAGVGIVSVASGDHWGRGYRGHYNRSYMASDYGYVQRNGAYVGGTCAGGYGYGASCNGYGYGNCYGGDCGGWEENDHDDDCDD